jgi:hypothetical protein
LKGREGDSASTDLVVLMAANKNAAIGLRVAEGQLDRFQAVRDSTRRIAVGHVLSAYGVTRNGLAFQLSAYEKVDLVENSADLVELKRQASDAAVAFQQGSELLLQATALAFGSVIVPAPGDSDHIALDISAEERSELVSALDSQFGPELRAGGDKSGPMASARLLLDKLEEGWRLAR